MSEQEKENPAPDPSSTDAPMEEANESGDDAAETESGEAADEALDDLQQAVSEIEAEVDGSASVPEFPTFDTPESSGDISDLNLLSDVNLHVKVELGRTRMYVEDVLRLNPGSVVELEKPAGDPVDVYVNDRHVARGEVIVVNDSFCVRVNEILQHHDGDESRPTDMK